METADGTEEMETGETETGLRDVDEGSGDVTEKVEMGARDGEETEETETSGDRWRCELRTQWGRQMGRYDASAN